MATPQVKVQTPNIQLNYRSPQSVRFDTFQLDGSPLDVSSGYTVALFQRAALNSPNPRNIGTDMAGSCTPVFDSTGVTINFNQTQVNNISDLCESTQNQYVLRISNDGGSSQSLLGQGTLTLNDPNFF